MPRSRSRSRSRERNRGRGRERRHRDKDRDRNRRSRSYSQDRNRSRSRSRSRDRDKSRSRSRGRNRRSRSRSRSRSREDHKRKSFSGAKKTYYESAAPGLKTATRESIAAAAELEANLSPEEQMARLMGFTGFSTTKNKVIESNIKGAAKGAVYKVPQRKWRQYMNRRDGFNKPVLGSSTTDR